MNQPIQRPKGSMKPPQAPHEAISGAPDAVNRLEYLANWLPTRGVALFVLLVAGLLIMTPSVWSHTQSNPSATSLNTASHTKSTVSLGDGLVVYYQLEGNADDSSGFGNHGTVQNANFTSGQFGQGLEFTGEESSHVEVPHSTSLETPDAVTISAWAKVYSNNTFYSGFIYKAGENPTSGLRDRVFTLWARSDGGVHFTSTPDGARSQTTCNASAGSYNHNEFVHIVGVIDAFKQIMLIYVNGSKVGECSYPGNQIRGGEYPMRIGGYFHSGGDQSGLTGIIDDVRIYNRALSDSEVQALFNIDPTVSPTPTPTLPVATPTPTPKLVPIVESTFDADDEGWKVSGDAQGNSDQPDYFPKGGNPSAYISATDDAQGIYWYWQAPAQFLGDLSQAYSGTLTFDLKQSSTSNPIDANDIIILTGGGLTLIFDTPYHPDTEWTGYTIPLSESAGWTKEGTDEAPTQTEMQTVLSSLTQLLIRGEYHIGVDTGDLDNVVINAIPGGETVTPTPTQAPNATSTPTLAPPATATPLPTQQPWIASYPFVDGFEGSRLGRGWSMLDHDNDNANGGDEPYALGRGWTGSFTAQGAVRVRGEAAYAGNAGVLLDDLVQDDIDSTAALRLTIDLAGQSNTELSFWWREFNDENDAEDGVFISDDWGATWHRVFSFNNGLGEYRQERIDLDAAAQANGLTFNDHFQIKFQFFDNHPYPNDGYAIDEVRVEPRGETDPSPIVTDAYEEDDECGSASTLIVDGMVQEHTFHDEADTDWIKFEVNEGITYTIEALVPPSSQADVALELYDACDDEDPTGQDHHFAADVRLILTAPADATYYLQLKNHDSSVFGEDVAYSLSVREPQGTPGAGALILVAGKLRENDPVQPNIHHVTNAVYNYARANGCTADQIYYLASEELDANGDGQSDVDAIANNNNLQEAITEWAAEQVGPDKPLTIYMMDHGGEDELYLDGQDNTVTAQELDGWLTQLEGNVAQLESNVIVEACYSGSFISPSHQISRDGRAIIASTGDLSLAYASGEGAVFSDALLNALAQGMTLRAAFTEARLAAREAHPDQTAWLDDTGDGRFDANDGQLLAERGLACAVPPIAEIWPAYIPQAEIRNLNGQQGEIWAEVRDDKDEITTVRAIIYPPSYTQPDSSDELQPEPEPILLTSEGNDTYRVLYEQFNEYGTYRILLYADDQDGLTSRPYEITFERVAEPTKSDGQLKLYLPTIRR